MDLKQKYREETNLEPYGDIDQKDNYTKHYVKWLEKQCYLYGVGSSYCEHKAKVLTKEDVEQGRSNAYKYLNF